MKRQNEKKCAQPAPSLLSPNSLDIVGDREEITATMGSEVRGYLFNRHTHTH